MGLISATVYHHSKTTPSFNEARLMESNISRAMDQDVTNGKKPKLFIETTKKSQTHKMTKTHTQTKHKIHPQLLEKSLQGNIGPLHCSKSLLLPFLLHGAPDDWSFLWTEQPHLFSSQNGLSWEDYSFLKVKGPYPSSSTHPL